ncbi:Uncharacterized protein ChrSV_4177 [Chromobacterium vaccinii]|nr:Uncharacterized protein ChrSW_4177 [Chromobacterium vaccinii]QND91634.1 Uncharacterized protein ChrSV_4177 [Chromobacterium vaccinii]
MQPINSELARETGEQIIEAVKEGRRDVMDLDGPVSAWGAE